MAIGKWISSLKGLFDEGPLKELTEEVAEKQETKLSAENVVITDEFRKTFNVLLISSSLMVRWSLRSMSSWVSSWAIPLVKKPR